MRTITNNSKWKHFKGKIVEVLLTGRDSETLEEVVVYTHDNEVWVRKKEEFLSEVDKEKYKDVKQKYRFEKIEENE